MWFRYSAISFLNVCVGMAILVALLVYALPDETPALVLQLIGWALGFALAFAFAHWAFNKKVPTRGDVIALSILHGIAFFFIYAIYGALLSDRGTAAILSPELLVQLGLEIVAIAFTGYLLRRRKL